MSAFEDRLYAIFFYVLVAACVAAVAIWVLWLSKKAKNKGRNR